MAANMRSAALAYRMGSPRQDSRYSAIGMSVSRRASKERAKALNSESLYMNPLCLFVPDIGPNCDERQTLPPGYAAHSRISANLVPIGYSLCGSRQYVKICASTALSWCHCADHLGWPTAGFRHFRGVRLAAPHRAMHLQRRKDRPSSESETAAESSGRTTCRLVSRAFGLF